MRQVLNTALLLIIALAGWQLYSSRTPAPCTQPVTYQVGTFDTRFGLSKMQFISALAEAESVWEQALRGEGLSQGRELFTYSPDAGKLKVNLIYDYRQEATQELHSIEGEVQAGQSDYKALESDYKELKGRYDVLKVRYDTEASAFAAHNTAYEQAIERWNSGPRRSREEFDALEAARLNLESEARDLKRTESALNELVRELNALAGQLNGLAKELNLGVDQYNSIGAARGETFAGGLYVSDAAGERIDIFEFSSREKLVRVLAHELGHALGLDHISDLKAIMYYLNQGEAGKLTTADIAALKTLCGVE